MIVRLKNIIFIKLRIFKYRLLSTSQNIKGKPKFIQPILLNSLGEIHFGNKVQFGVHKSPKFYNTYSYLEARKTKAKIIIGNNVAINNNFSAIAEKSTITIKDGVLIGLNCQIVDSNFHGINPRERNSGKHSSADVTIEKNVFIGNNVTILKGVTIGENSIISTGSVVSKNIPKNVIIAGVPAKVIKTING